MIDPNYFALDWNQASEVLGAVVLLSIVVERFLSLFFENEWYRQRLQDRHIKEPIALGTALVLCFSFKFDAVAVLLKQDSWTVIGTLLTAGVIAGGSKGSIKLFIDVMKIRNLSPDEEKQEGELRLAKREQKISEARARGRDADSDNRSVGTSRKKTKKKSTKKRSSKRKATKRKSSKKKTGGDR